MKRIVFLVVVAAAMLVPGSPASAAGSTTASGALTPVVENPNASPHGRGGVTLTMSADRTHLDWRITYAGVSIPITAVEFCGGENPRAYPIDPTCAFVIPQAPGGPSPIIGSRTIDTTQAALLASGFAVVQLQSAQGPQLSGYIAIGSPMPDTATASTPAVRQGDIGFVVVLGGLAGAVLILGGRPRRRIGTRGA